MNTSSTTAPSMWTWSMRAARDAFAQLPPCHLEELVGRWDGEMVGRPNVRRLSRALAATGPLRGWCGKEIHHSGTVTNLVRRRDAVRESVLAMAADGSSILDGLPAVVVDYSRTTKPPVSWLRGELRWASPGDEVLGVLLLRIGPRSVGPLPFRMVRHR